MQLSKIIKFNKRNHLVNVYIQGVSGGMVNILGHDCTYHFNQKNLYKYVSYY